MTDMAVGQLPRGVPSARAGVTGHSHRGDGGESRARIHNRGESDLKTQRGAKNPAPLGAGAAAACSGWLGRGARAAFGPGRAHGARPCSPPAPGLAGVI